MLKKMSIESAREHSPRVDQKVQTLASGFAQWGIMVAEFQSLGWPWVLVPIEHSADVMKLVSLWNVLQRKKNQGAKSWVVYPSGDMYVVPHPVHWLLEYEVVRVGAEFGRFLSALSPDALTRNGFREAERKLKAQGVLGDIGIGPFRLRAI